MDGRRAQGAAQASRVARRAELAQRVPVPERRVVSRDAVPRHVGGRPLAVPPSRRHHRGRFPRRPDQGGGRRGPRHPPRPLPADRDLTMLGHRHRLRRGWSPGPRREHDQRPRRGAAVMSDSHDLYDAERVTVGTIGPTGQRVFLLQGRQGSLTVTVKLEKQQVAALSQYLAKVLEELPDPGILPEDLELEEPLDAAWVVGTLGLSYDSTADRIVLLAEEAVPEEEEVDEADETNASMARFTITREQAAALAIRGTELVEAGRPPCPLCGNPLDPSGHVCPRTNGHRPPVL